MILVIIFVSNQFWKILHSHRGENLWIHVVLKKMHKIFCYIKTSLKMKKKIKKMIFRSLTFMRFEVQYNNLQRWKYGTYYGITDTAIKIKTIKFLRHTSECRTRKTLVRVENSDWFLAKRHSRAASSGAKNRNRKS